MLSGALNLNGRGICLHGNGVGKIMEQNLTFYHIWNPLSMDFEI